MRKVENIELFLRKKYYRYIHSKKTNTIKWGIIGTGYMANKFSAVINADENCEVVGVVSRHENKAKVFSKSYSNCIGYSSLESMLLDQSDKIDVVYIATPVDNHLESAKKCLDRGISVLCEKPITMNTQELNELISLAEERKCMIIEAMWMKFLPTFKQAEKLLEQKAIGKVEMIKVDFYKRDLKKYFSNDLSSPNSSGVLMDYGIYALSFITYFLKGVPEDINAQSYSSLGIDTNWMIFGKLQEVRICINISANYNSISKAIIYGSKGAIEFDSPFNRTNRLALLNEKGENTKEFKYKYRFEGFEFQVEETLELLKAKYKSKLYKLRLEETIHSMNFIDKLIK